MNKIILTAIAFLLSSSAALADSPLRLTPCGYQQITSIASAKSLTVPTTCGATPVTLARITIEAQAVRYRDDGSAPTATVGMPMAVAASLDYSGALSKIQFIEQTSGGIVNVSYYH